MTIIEITNQLIHNPRMTPKGYRFAYSSLRRPKGLALKDLI